MQADREKYISKISSYSHEMLIAELSALYDTLSEKLRNTKETPMLFQRSTTK